MTAFKRNERVEALDTVCGIWRQATLLETPDSPLGPFRIQYDFSASRDPDKELVEPRCQGPSQTLPIRKIGTGSVPDLLEGGSSSRRQPRRGSRMWTTSNPTTRGEAMMKATRLFGYTNSELGYNPETLTLLQSVSSQH